MKYCEDLLQKWDKRIQFEATLFFFFSVVSGSSFVSSFMFRVDNVLLNFLPFLYLLTMFCWWYVCKRMIFNTLTPIPKMKYILAISMLLWLFITCIVSLGTWDEWGWNNKDTDVPMSDNLYRLFNCLLVFFYIGCLSYDYYYKVSDRHLRIKFWMLFIWSFSVVSFSYFLEWVIDAHRTGDNESIVGRYLATIGTGVLAILGVVVFCSSQMHKSYLCVLFAGITMYWWGSASLDCDFYADTADMTVMPGYQMLWTMAILVLLESLPTLSSEIYILGEQMLIDDDEQFSQPGMTTTTNRNETGHQFATINLAQVGRNNNEDIEDEFPEDSREDIPQVQANNIR